MQCKHVLIHRLPVGKAAQMNGVTSQADVQVNNALNLILSWPILVGDVVTIEYCSLMIYKCL